MIGTCESIIKWLFSQKRETIFEIKEHKEKRSLSQNAYYWKLVSEVARKMNLSNQAVHFQMLKDYSQVAYVPIKTGINASKFFKYCEFERECEIKGVKFNLYKVYEASSEMNKNEFKRLLEGIIQEAKQQGIQTMTTAEIQKLRYIENE